MRWEVIADSFGNWTCCLKRSPVTSCQQAMEEVMPRPLRGWNGAEWGLEGLSSFEKSQVQGDDVLMLRFLVLFVVSETLCRANGTDQPTTLILEQPAPPGG